MFRGIFGILAALIATTSSAPAAISSADVPLDQRIANAKVRMTELGMLARSGDATRNTEANDSRLAQHWNNFHWNNFNNHWHNWHNQHWGDHHR